MAINRGPWNALVDDDGSNLVGSVWNKAAIKTVILDPVDAAIIPAAPAVLTWTPIDASGAGLTFTGIVAHYTQLGKVVMFWAAFTYPSTANSSPARVGGLPLANGPDYCGAFTTYGVARQFSLAAGGTVLDLFTLSTGAQTTNAQMSGAGIIFQGSYWVT